MDLSGLGFTDCAGLSVLVGAHKRLAGSGHRLVITGAKPAVQRLLHLTGLGTYLHLSTPEAISGNPDEGIYTLWGSITGSDLGGLLGWHHR
jgi:anti-anti-sigma regulatory factor